MGRGGVAVATVMGTVRVRRLLSSPISYSQTKKILCTQKILLTQVGPGGVAISTPVAGSSAGNGGIAIAGAEGLTIALTFQQNSHHSP